MSGTRDTLFVARIRMDEAALWRTVGGWSVWTSGPRIREAMDVPIPVRYRWTDCDEREDAWIEDVQPGDPSPVLVIRSRKSRGNVCRIDGAMAELDENGCSSPRSIICAHGNRKPA